MKEAPAPSNINELRSLLGLAGFYSKFVPHFSDVVEPLRALLRGNEPFAWTSAAEESFVRLKSLLTTCKVLHFFDPNLPVIVTTDASGYGLGAVLQQDNKGILQTVAFASRTLSPQERKYSAGEREALACVWACEHWHVYLWGRPFVLRTDHSALVTLLSTKGVGHRPLRISRWSARLLCYNYTVEYRKGSDNVVADALSRLPLQGEANQVAEDEFVCLLSPMLTIAELQAESASDSTIAKVMDFVLSSWPDKVSLEAELMPYFHVRAELSIVHDLLYRGDRIVIPSTLTRRLMEVAHESHPGISRTKSRLRELYWWPRMDNHVEQLVKTCVVCQSCDKSARPTAAPMQPVAFPDNPWEKIAIDIIGPFEQAPITCRYAVTLIDYHSKWPEVFFARQVSTATVKNFLLQVFSREGYPSEMVSDHGPQFSSAEFEEFLQERGIRHCFSSVYHPQANGLVERFNRVLKSVVQMAVYERRDIRVAVTDYLGVYRCTPHATTGVAPAVLLHGRLPRTRLSIVGLPDSSFHENPAQAMKWLRQRVRQNQASSKLYTDCRRGARTRHFAVGDYVRVRKSSVHGKISSRFSEPKKISEQRGPASFLLDDGRVWNASIFQAIHPKAAEKCTGNRPGILEWTLPLPDESLQGGAFPASEQHADCPSTSRQEVAAQASSESSTQPSSLQDKMTGQPPRKSARVKKTPLKLRDYALRKR